MADCTKKTPRWLLMALVVGMALCGVDGGWANEPDAWKQLFTDGVKAREAAHYAEAEQLLQRALREAEQAGPDDARVATAANNLGLLYHDQGRLQEAQSLYTRALAMWEQHLGPEHEDVAAALNNLAEIAHAEGDWGRAEPLYETGAGNRAQGAGRGAPRCRDQPEQSGRVVPQAGTGDSGRIDVSPGPDSHGRGPWHGSPPIWGPCSTTLLSCTRGADSMPGRNRSTCAR
jgi:hypothetical protein